jgi:hypothetical protein
MKKPFTQDGRMRKGVIVVSKKSSFYDDFEDFNNDDEVEEEDDMSYMTQEDKARLEMFRSQIIMSTSGDTNQLATNDFNEEEEEEEDDDDDNNDDEDEEEEEEFDDSDEGTVQENMASFNSVDDLISFAAGGLQQNKQREWAIPLIDHDDSSSNYENTSLQMANAVVKALKSGVILIANPEKFCAPSKNINNNSKKQPSPSLLSKFGLTLPPPSDLGPDRKADLLPVLILLERHPLRGSKAVLLNRRTGYLLGDLEQTSTNTASPPPKLGAFMIQPLWFGGTSASAGTAGGGGLDMLHQCPTVQGCQQLTEDGLFWGGDIMQAQEAMLDCNSLERPMTGFDFKFFVQSTRWLPTQVSSIFLIFGTCCGQQQHVHCFLLSLPSYKKKSFLLCILQKLPYTARERSS